MEIDPSADAAPADPEAIPQGTPVGEYVLEGLIGSGGFARVYRARHPVLETHVAIKVLSRALSLDTEARRRFVQEARAASRISHPNVVRVLGFGVLADGRAYQVMELIDGVSLDEISRPAPDEALRLLAEIASGLEAAHATGIVHRDLKPANILIARDGSAAKLADFGIAKALEDDAAQHLTRTGATLGTPVYMSPEQALGREIGIASDLYSFGVVAFELLTGQPPFEAASPLETMMQHVQTSPPTASAIAPSLGTRFDRALARMLAKHPEDRPANIAACIDALRGSTPARSSSRWWLAAGVVAVAIGAALIAWPSASEEPATPTAEVAPVAIPPPDAAATVSPSPTVVPPTPDPTRPARPAPARHTPTPRPTASEDSFEAPPDYQHGAPP